jgi:hypothetical protein
MNNTSISSHYTDYTLAGYIMGIPEYPFVVGCFFLSTLKQAVDFYPLSNQMKPIYQPINQSINHHLSIVPPDF